MGTSYNDLAIVHKYIDQITTFIQGIVKEDATAVVLACVVFEQHKKLEKTEPFTSEEKRLGWLLLKSRNIAMQHLKQERYDQQEVKAVKKAIHDCS